MARIFVYEQRQFPDPDPRMAVDDVRRQFAEFFPELANADVREERRGDDVVYTFARRIGTKGARRRPGVVAVLLSGLTVIGTVSQIVSLCLTVRGTVGNCREVQGKPGHVA
jgi:PRTRC genetic system protein C